MRRSGDPTMSEITQDHLVSVRYKNRGNNGKIVIGDKKSSLNSNIGLTKAIFDVRIGSLLQHPALVSQDKQTLSIQQNLEFSTLTEEAESDYGRSIIEIILDGGVDAFEELGELAPQENPWLLSNLYEKPVWEVAQEHDRKVQLITHPEDQKYRFGGKFSSPQILSATYLNDNGEEKTIDIRKFIPSSEWIRSRWSNIGARKYGYARKSDTTEEFNQYVSDPTETTKVYINQSANNITLHRITDIEESIVDDEPNRVVSSCGNTFQDTTLEIANDDLTFRCGNCNWE